MSMKNPLTPAGIEPATYRFVGPHTIDGRVDERGIRKDSVGSDRNLIEVLNQHSPRLAEKNHGSIVCVPWPPTEHKSRALPLNKPAVPIQPEHTGNRFNRNVVEALS